MKTGNGGESEDFSGLWKKVEQSASLRGSAREQLDRIREKGAEATDLDRFTLGQMMRDADFVTDDEVAYILFSLVEQMSEDERGRLLDREFKDLDSDDPAINARYDHAIDRIHADMFRRHGEGSIARLLLSDRHEFLKMIQRGRESLRGSPALARAKPRSSQGRLQQAGVSMAPRSAEGASPEPSAVNPDPS